MPSPAPTSLGTSSPTSFVAGEPARASAAPLPAPVAARLRPPSWRDARLLVGVLLVLGSMAVGARVVSAADHTVPVWAAARTLPVGTPLTEDNLVPRRVRLDTGGDLYLDGSASPEPGKVLLRAVGAGELVPRSAVGPAARLRVRPVSIELGGPAPASLVAGALVDMWVAAKTGEVEGKSFGAPDLLVRNAEVSGISADDGTFASGTRSVEVLVPEGQLSQVLGALANGSVITLAPVPGSAPVGDDS